MTVLTFNEKDIASLTPDDIASLANRLEADDYTNPFEGLKDWHLLRTIAFHRQDLVQPYLYLLDIQAYDES